MMNKLFFWSITSALAGFLFGFDTVVISGAEQKIQNLWGLSDGIHGIAIGAALYGTVVGALVGGWPTDRFGRRATLLWIGIFYFVSAVGSALAPEVVSFVVARFLGGLGVGISTVAAPLYISEIAPAAKRGRLAGMFQFNIVFGILIAFLSNALISGAGPNDWRWMLAAEAFPALAYSAMCFFIPESPRWLIGRGRREEAMAILKQSDPSATNESVAALANEIAHHFHKNAGGKRPKFWVKRLRVPVLLAFLIAFFNQLSGINAILYFAPRIFEMTGLGAKAAMLQSIGIGITNLVFTFVGLWLIDRLGRRALLYIGSFGYIASLGLTSWAFYTGHHSIVPTCIFAFIAAHAVGQGAVIWVFISEIFPNEHRAMGQSLGSSTHWVFAALLATAFPKMVSLFSPGTVFLIFTGMMVLQLFWVALMVPETKGVPLEELEEKLGLS
ncbi:MAG: sugar porter family MFS transporter [Akkermansiaceae bacterium]|nr:sugar porter family MFS transporter [Akkermansiaceae bacterium]